MTVSPVLTEYGSLSFFWEFPVILWGTSGIPFNLLMSLQFNWPNSGGMLKRSQSANSFCDWLTHFKAVRFPEKMKRSEESSTGDRAHARQACGLTVPSLTQTFCGHLERKSFTRRSNSPISVKYVYKDEFFQLHLRSQGTYSICCLSLLYRGKTWCCRLSSGLLWTLWWIDWFFFYLFTLCS